jgi:hypothetical protein
VSLKHIRKTNAIAGKGHNEMLEGVNPVEHTRATNNEVDVHVPENGGTCVHCNRPFLTEVIPVD